MPPQSFSPRHAAATRNHRASVWMVGKMHLQRSILLVAHGIHDPVREDSGLKKNHARIIRHWRITCQGGDASLTTVNAPQTYAPCRISLAAAMWHLLPLFANSGRSVAVANLGKTVAREISAPRRFSLIAISGIASCSCRAADSHAARHLARTRKLRHPLHSILRTGVRFCRPHLQINPKYAILCDVKRYPY